MSKVFISWSGTASGIVANALAETLPVIIQSVEPFTSQEDLQKGGRWHSELSKQLQDSNFGIACLTPDNLDSAWILYEAGAITKFVDDAHLSPFLLNVKPSEIPAPLTAFNATGTTKDDVLRLVRSINLVQNPPLTDSILVKAFDASWGHLSSEIERAAKAVSKKGAQRSSTNSSGELDQILQEILVAVRAQSQILNSPPDLLPASYLRHALNNSNRILPSDIADALFNAISLIDRAKDALLNTVDKNIVEFLDRASRILIMEIRRNRVFKRRDEEEEASRPTRGRRVLGALASSGPDLEEMLGANTAGQSEDGRES